MKKSGRRRAAIACCIKRWQWGNGDMEELGLEAIETFKRNDELMLIEI